MSPGSPPRMKIAGLFLAEYPVLFRDSLCGKTHYNSGSCWIPGSWMYRWRTTRLVSPSPPCSPSFSMAFKMSDDSRTTLEHKTPESNKSVSWIGRVSLLPVPATATKASERCARIVRPTNGMRSFRCGIFPPRLCPASKILTRIWTMNKRIRTSGRNQTHAMSDMF